MTSKPSGRSALGTSEVEVRRGGSGIGHRQRLDRGQIHRAIAIETLCSRHLARAIDELPRRISHDGAKRLRPTNFFEIGVRVERLIWARKHGSSFSNCEETMQRSLDLFTAAIVQQDCLNFSRSGARLAYSGRSFLLPFVIAEDRTDNAPFSTSIRVAVEHDSRSRRRAFEGIRASEDVDLATGSHGQYALRDKLLLELSIARACIMRNP